MVKNIVLLGMPCAGKSTVGVILAGLLGRPFVDTDLLIRRRQGRRLQAIIDERGIGGFLEVERDAVLSLDCRGAVIATGGSVVHSEQAMGHLRGGGILIHLRVVRGELLRRMDDIATRGIVMGGDEDLEALYERRRPLYERHADLSVDTDGRDVAGVVEEIVARIPPA